MKMFRKTIFLALMGFFSTAFAEQRPVLYDIESKAYEEDKIILTWKVPLWNTGASPSGIYIFRDTKPLDNLYGKIPLAILSPNSESYTDRPGDFKEYYYAAIVATNPNAKTNPLYDEVFYYDEQLDALPKDEKDLILEGINSTTRGCRINGIVHTAENLETMEKNRLLRNAENKDYSGGLLREKPLPLMDFPKEIEHVSQIDHDTKTKAQKLADSKVKSHKKVQGIYIFPEDQDGKNTYTDALIRKDFSKAQKELNKILADKNTDQDKKNRAKFYLAQCLYFTGDLEKAAKEFTLLLDIFPKQSYQWAKASLDMMVEKK